MSKMTVGDVELAYTVQGKGPCLLLIAGLGQGQWCWHEVLPHLTPQFQVVTLDNRGSDGSSKPPGPYSTTQMAHDVLGLMEALGLEKAAVLGHSLGSFIAQELTLAAPERVTKLILVSSAFGGPNMVPIPAPALATMTDRSGSPRDLFERALSVSAAPNFPRRHPGRAEALWRYRTTSSTTAASFQAQMLAGAGHDSETRLSRIKCPVLLIHGTEDQVVPVGNVPLLKQRMPNAQVHLLQGCGHFVPLEEPEVLADQISAFLL